MQSTTFEANFFLRAKRSQNFYFGFSLEKSICIEYYFISILARKATLMVTLLDGIVVIGGKLISLTRFGLSYPQWLMLGSVKWQLELIRLVRYFRLNADNIHGNNTSYEPGIIARCGLSRMQIEAIILRS